MKSINIVITMVLLLSLAIGSGATAGRASASTPDLTLLCEIDIGNEASEGGNHNLVGWGPIEPDTHPYPSQSVPVWDGLTSARVVWGARENTPCATLTLDRHLTEGAARMMRIAWLDGIAYNRVISDDSFTVEVKNHSADPSEYQEVFSWTGGFTHEWQTADIDLTGLGLNENGWIDVRFCSTASPWKYFKSDLGQVAIDWIKLYGETPNGGGGEGFTPGYWKNHLEDWTGLLDPGADFETTFGIQLPSRVGGPLTLLEAVNKKGNRINSLIRHSVAALLNALHPNVDYDLTPDEVIAIVQDGFASGDYRGAKDILEGFNEQGGDING
jgi:hypothetical protein